MLFFGHIGITAGAAKAYDSFLSKAILDNSLAYRSKFASVIGRQRLKFYLWQRKIRSEIGSVDYRIVLLGSLLPDIIDKPVFFLIGNRASLSGRDYAHTLLFNLVLLLGGVVLVRYRKSWLLIISLSSFTHLILDQIWSCPVVLFWPLLGPLSRGETTGWASGILHGLFSSPEVYIPEIIGLVIVLLFAYRLVRRKSITSFIRNGDI